MRQTKWESLKESIWNVILGFWIGVLAQILYLNFYKGVDIDFFTNMEFALFMTLISVVRSYAIRRWNEYKLRKKTEGNTLSDR